VSQLAKQQPYKVVNVSATGDQGLTKISNTLTVLDVGTSLEFKINDGDTIPGSTGLKIEGVPFVDINVVSFAGSPVIFVAWVD
jgi:hypothetical protein